MDSEGIRMQGISIGQVQDIEGTRDESQDGTRIRHNGGGGIRTERPTTVSSRVVVNIGSLPSI